MTFKDHVSMTQSLNVQKVMPCPTQYATQLLQSMAISCLHYWTNWSPSLCCEPSPDGPKCRGEFGFQSA